MKHTSTQTFSGQIEEKNGQKIIRWNSPDFLKYQISKFSIGDKITAYITNKKPKRSEQQNRLYWLYIKNIEDETGNESEDLHTYFRGKYLSKGITEVFGSKVRKYKSTTQLNKSEFVEYLLSIEVEVGVHIPDTENYIYGD